MLLRRVTKRTATKQAPPIALLDNLQLDVASKSNKTVCYKNGPANRPSRQHLMRPSLEELPCERRPSLEELYQEARHSLEELAREGRPSLENSLHLMRPSLEELPRERRPSLEELLHYTRHSLEIFSSGIVYMYYDLFCHPYSVDFFFVF